MKAGLLLITILLGLPAVVTAGNRNFTKRSLDALTSAPTVSAARWQELLKRRPQSVLDAIADAERKGWKPTTVTTALGHTSPPQPGVRPIALQDLYAAGGGGEILVWNWSDGNPTTVEGIVWAHSWITGNYVVFNVQLAGSWSAPYITYYAYFDAQMTPTGYVMWPAATWDGVRQPMFRLAQFGQSSGGYDACQVKGFAAGGRCLGHAAGDYARRMAEHAAVGAIVGGVGGAVLGSEGGPAGSLSGALGGALIGEGTGAVEGLVTEFIFGVDHHCVDEANYAHDRCMFDLAACNSHQRSADWCEQQFGRTGGR